MSTRILWGMATWRKSIWEGDSGKKGNEEPRGTAFCKGRAQGAKTIAKCRGKFEPELQQMLRDKGQNVKNGG